MLTLMDNKLKAVNNDTELTIYKILATSQDDGFMEFV